MATHVLVVEDDPAFSRMLRRMLEAAEFSVATAPDFKAAIAVIESDAPLDVLLTDLNLPTGTPQGLSIGLMAKRKRPDLKIVYMTGYDAKDLARFAENAPILHKPFTKSELTETIKRVLG
jgi:CheY-like chemotaxis protein